MIRKGSPSAARRVVAAVALALTLAGGCRPSAPPPQADDCPVLPAAQVRGAPRDAAPAAPEPAAPDDLLNAQVDSTRAYLLIADSAYQTAGSPLVQLCGVQVQLYDSLGAPGGVLTARTGEYDPETGVMVARGEVVVEMREMRRRVETEELHYDPRADRIWSPVESYVEQEGARMRAASFTSDSRLENIQAERARGWFRW